MFTMRSQNESLAAPAQVKFNRDLPSGPRPLGGRWYVAAMSEEQSFEEAIEEPLDLIDRILAERGISLSQRPTRAAVELVNCFIPEVSTDGGPEGKPPGEFMDYASEPWFRIVHRAVTDWYGRRFGQAIQPEERDVKAVVSILGTPFSMRVPMNTTEPGEPGESFWLCFHDEVRDHEDPLDWVIQGPNLAALSQKDVKKARDQAKEIASRLRSIHVLLMGMKADDPVVREMRDGIVPNLERAAESLTKGKPDTIKIAHWDLQLACEHALKCLMQERSGTFAQTHDLFVLYDRTPGNRPAFPRYVLSRLPNWELMAEMRYGRGPAVPFHDAMDRYRAALRVVEGALDSMQKAYRLGSAKFHLKRPPWPEGS